MIDFCKLVQSHLDECEKCRQQIRAEIAALAGSSKSEKKSQAARENGKLGGRPRKS